MIKPIKEIDIHTVKKLLKNRAKISEPDDKGMTPLHYAAGAGNDMVCRLLVNGGADLFAADHEGYTIFHAACSGGVTWLVEELLARNINIHMRDKWNSFTPLHLAAEGGHLDIVRMLLEFGANPMETDHRSFTPLFHATLPVMKVLVQYGAKLGGEDQYGYTLLHHACMRGDEGMIFYLLEQGLNPRSKSKQGEEPWELIPNNSLRRMIQQAIG